MQLLSVFLHLAYPECWEWQAKKHWLTQRPRPQKLDQICFTDGDTNQVHVFAIVCALSLVFAKLVGKHVTAKPCLRATFSWARASIQTILVSARGSIRGFFCSNRGLLPRLEPWKGGKPHPLEVRFLAGNGASTDGAGCRSESPHFFLGSCLRLALVLQRWGRKWRRAKKNENEKGIPSNPPLPSTPTPSGSSQHTFGFGMGLAMHHLMKRTSKSKMEGKQLRANRAKWTWLRENERRREALCRSRHDQSPNELFHTCWFCTVTAELTFKYFVDSSPLTCLMISCLTAALKKERSGPWGEERLRTVLELFLNWQAKWNIIGQTHRAATIRLHRAPRL